MAVLEAYRREMVGEHRLALLRGDRLVGMRIRREGDGLSAGTIVDARLTATAGGRGFAVAAGQQLLVQPLPAGASEGAGIRVKIVRGAWMEPGRERLARATAAPGASVQSPPTLEQQAEATGAVMRPGWPDHVESQWDDGWQAAELGRRSFPGGMLNLSPTPAFLAVDVDGSAPDPVAACRALAEAVQLWDLSGSIVIDLPNADRAARQAAAAAIDSGLADRPFERTAVNGFGLMQIVLPRRGPTILERAMLDRAGSAAIALLAAAQREARPGALELRAAPAIARWLTARPQLLDALRTATGRRVDVLADAVAGQGHVTIAQR